MLITVKQKRVGADITKIIDGNPTTEHIDFELPKKTKNVDLAIRTNCNDNNIIVANIEVYEVNNKYDIPSDVLANYLI